MIKKLLITGAKGQVATEYQMSSPLQNWEFIFLDREELDITKKKSIDKVFKEHKPNAVLNLAAYTNVERAEKEDLEKSFEVNATACKLLAITCKNYDIPLIHISTDYVFDGKQETPYIEGDLENPINNYGRSKFVGEKWIQENHDWYYIIRVAWVYSNHSKNFYTTMLNMAQERNEVNVVNDQFGSPTSSKEICRAIDSVLLSLDRDKTGVYHFNGLGKTTWMDFAEEIFKQTKLNMTVNGVSSAYWKSKVERPSDSYMNTNKFSFAFKYVPAHWKNALKEIISERKILPVKIGDVAIMNNEEHIIMATDWLKRTARIANINNINSTIEVPFEILTL